jgi:hypothetical protein
MVACWRAALEGARGRAVAVSGRRGVALISALLLLLTLTALAHGALLLARAEWMGSNARARAAEAEAVVTVRMDETLQQGLPPDLSDEPIWASRVLDDGTGSDGVVRIQRLGAESWWLEHGANGHAGRGTGVPGRLLWWMDPLARIRSLGAVLSVGEGAAWTVLGSVERLGFGSVTGPLDTAACGFGALTVTEVPDLVRVLPEAEMPFGLGLLSFDTLLARTAETVDGIGTPAPREEVGACVMDDPWNWGDPERLEAPCGSVVAVRAAESPLRVEGGVGQAALLVDGDVELAEDAKLYGFLMTSGVLRLRDQAELRGMGVALGGVVVGSGARVQGSACWAARALYAARAQWMPMASPVPGVPPIAP